MFNKLLKKNCELTGFMHKGETGNWRKHFTPELEKRFEEWEKKGLAGSDLKFTYDL